MEKVNLKKQIEVFEKYLDSLHLDCFETPEKGLHLISMFKGTNDAFKQQMWSRIPPLINQENPSSEGDRQWIRWVWGQTFRLFKSPKAQILNGTFDRQRFHMNLDLIQLPLSLRSNLLKHIFGQQEKPQNTLFFSFKFLHALRYWGICPQDEVSSESSSDFQSYQKWNQRVWHTELTRTAKGIRTIEYHLDRPLHFKEDPQLGWDFEMLLFTLLNSPWKPHKLDVDLAPWERDLLGGGDLSIRLKSKTKRSLKGWLQVSLSAEQSIHNRKQATALKKGCFWVLSPWSLAQSCPPNHAFGKLNLIFLLHCKVEPI